MIGLLYALGVVILFALGAIAIVATLLFGYWKLFGKGMWDKIFKKKNQ